MNLMQSVAALALLVAPVAMARADASSTPISAAPAPMEGGTL
jgi:hypothetical protein